MTFFEECRNAREERKISISEMARQTGYTHQAISAFETGKNLSINIDMLLWYLRNTHLFRNVRGREYNEN